MADTQSFGIYTIDPNADKMELRDHLHTRLLQLHAMLMITYGCGAETFQNWSKDVQENYMWACSSMADECKGIARLL